MSEPPTQPILVRDGNVVSTAVGVSDPSLTLVEFEDGIGFFLAESFQSDDAASLDFLETVSLREYSGDWWIASEHERIVLGWSLAAGGEMERQSRELKIEASSWTPAVFFLSTEEFLAHQSSLAEGVPELVLKAVIDRAEKVESLSEELRRLRTRHQEALRWLFASMPGGRVKPKKEIIHISLPPKPGIKDSISPTFPLKASLSVPSSPSSLDPITAAYLEEKLGKLKRIKPPENPPPQS